MFQAHMRRPVLSVRDSLRMIETENDVDSLTSNKQIRAHVQVHLNVTLYCNKAL